MSLSHIQGQRQPLTFGSDLNVLIADTIINGDLDVQGLINGTSSQGQNDNNVFTGTNTYSVYRPSSSLVSSGLQDGVNDSVLKSKLSSESIINTGSTWTGTNDFSVSLDVYDATTIGVPTSGTDAVYGSYVKDSWDAKKASFYSSNNTWSGVSNTFQGLPTCLDPLVDTSIATKNYVDTTATNTAVGLSINEIGQSSFDNEDFGINNIAVEIQLIGAGGGSTSGTGDCNSCASAGTSGGAGAQCSIFILTSFIGALGGSFSTFNLSCGPGGSAGIGCADTAAAGNGTPTFLVSFPKAGSGLNPLSQQVVLNANGGSGFQGSCGQAGTPSGGIYSASNISVDRPLSSSSGANGAQCIKTIPNFCGINNMGFGGWGQKCQNGSEGGRGGFGITYYTN